MPANGFSDIQIGLCVVFLLLAPLAAAGLALINTGLVRSRNAAHSMMAALCAGAIACCLYFVCGRSWAGSAGEISGRLIIGGKVWSWIGDAPPFFMGFSRNGPAAMLTAWMGMVSAATVVLIPLGSGAERWRFASICASAAVTAGLTFPLFMHWAWGGGWLAALGVNYGIGAGYVDTGGSGTIHAVGGLTALAVAWILGPRRGKYSGEGMPAAIPGHSVVLILFGCCVAAVGSIALSGAGAILFSKAEPAQIALIAVNTVLGAGSAALAAAAITRSRFGRPDASLTANGWVGGLAAIASGCGHLPPAAAILVGFVAGAIVTYSVELLELRLQVDDPGGSISVHAAGAIWGLLATGLLGRFPPGQILAQVAGIATLLGFVLPLASGANALLNRVVPMRASREAERQGLDLFELGAGAYPDFITHSDDFMQR